MVATCPAGNRLHEINTACHCKLILLRGDRKSRATDYFLTHDYQMQTPFHQFFVGRGYALQMLSTEHRSATALTSKPAEERLQAS